MTMTKLSKIFTDLSVLKIKAIIIFECRKVKKMSVKWLIMLYPMSLHQWRVTLNQINLLSSVFYSILYFYSA